MKKRNDNVDEQQQQQQQQEQQREKVPESNIMDDEKSDKLMKYKL